MHVFHVARGQEGLQNILKGISHNIMSVLGSIRPNQESPVTINAAGVYELALKEEADNLIRGDAPQTGMISQAHLMFTSRLRRGG